MQITISELAKLIGGEAFGDGAITLSAVATIEQAGPVDLVFAESDRYTAAAIASNAGCRLVPPATDLAGTAAIVHPNPKLAFAKAAALLNPEPRHKPGIAPSATVASSVDLPTTVHVGPGAYIEDGVVIAENVVISAGCVVAGDVRIGPDTILHPRVTVYRGTTIGARCLIHAGAVLGSDGFGFVRRPEGLSKFPQVGSLVIGDDVEIGANTTIDRGALGQTRIGNGTKIDNLVQIAHNVLIGDHCAISAQVGISGSSTIADNVTLAGQVGLGDHVRIEEGVIVAGQAGIPSNKLIRKGQIVWGTPARPLREVKRQLVQIGRIESMREELERLRKKIEE